MQLLGKFIVGGQQEKQCGIGGNVFGFELWQLLVHGWLILYVEDGSSSSLASFFLSSSHHEAFFLLPFEILLSWKSQSDRLKLIEMVLFNEQCDKGAIGAPYVHLWFSRYLFPAYQNYNIQGSQGTLVFENVVETVGLFSSSFEI